MKSKARRRTGPAVSGFNHTEFRFELVDDSGNVLAVAEPNAPFAWRLKRGDKGRVVIA
jgi:hypothetical protein